MKRCAFALSGPCALLVLLLLVAAPCARADANAVITGNGVKLRAQPASYGKVLETVKKGTRVQLLFVAGFSDTVDGDTGSWCAVMHGNETGFIFGPYLALDSGAIPVIEGPAYDSRRDRLFYFAETMRRLFGTTEEEIRKRLGEPASTWEGEWGKCEGVRLKTLRYPDAGVEIELFYPTSKCGFLDEKEFVSGVMISGKDYHIIGLGPGSPLNAVIDVLGLEYEDLALRSPLYDLRYAPGEYPPYIVDFIYQMTVTGDAVTGREVVEVRFTCNVLGD